MEKIEIVKHGRKWRVIDTGVEHGVKFVAFEGNKKDTIKFIATSLNIPQSSIPNLYSGQVFHFDK